VIDLDGGISENWTDVVNITILNNGPEIGSIPDFSIEEDNVLVVDLTDYGTDAEDDPEELMWTVTLYNNRRIVNITGNGTTELSFTPRENFTGTANVRLLLEDRDNANETTWITLNWTIVYEAPRVIEYIVDETFVYRETTLHIITSVDDDDDDNASLIGTMEYLPSGAADWVNLPIMYNNSIWSTDFTPGPEWVTGVYTFRVSFQDTDELDSPWLWINITVLSNPSVESFSGPSEVYRTHTIRFYVNGSDANDDPEEDLVPVFGYSRSNVTYSTGSFGAPFYEDGVHQVNFTPNAGLELDVYYIRVRFVDTDGAVSEWAYLLIDVLNNDPKIVGTVPDDDEVEDNPIAVGLLNAGSDNENPAEDLNWTANWEEGIERVDGNGSRELTFVPVQDFTGDAEIELRLLDQDLASDSQFITLSWNPVNDAPRVSVLVLEADTTDLLGDYIFHTGTNMSVTAHDPVDPEGDDFSIFYSWLVNGAYIIENSTTDTTFGKNNFQRGDIVTVRVLMTDSKDERYYDNTTTIMNAPPTIGGVDLTIFYMGVETDAANESCTLQVTPYGYSDLDGEPADFDNFSYEWYNGGMLIASGLELTEIDGRNFSKDDEIWCRILPFDGNDYGIGGRSSTVPIFNTPPMLGDVIIEYTGGEPFGPNEFSVLVLNLSGYSDIDLDPVNGDDFLYSWYVNDLEIGVTSPTLSSDVFAKGDDVYCLVTPYDGEEYGDQVRSEITMIMNTPPTITDASINFTGPRPDKHSTLSLDMSGFEDLDGDLPVLIQFSYEWFWMGMSVGTDPTLDLTPFSRGDEIMCIVVPHDGTNSGNAVMTSNLTVVNTQPTFSGASIEITYLGQPVARANLSSELTASGIGFNDLDGDPELQARFTWYIDGSFAKSGNTIDGSYFAKGDRVHCVVEPFDGLNYGEAVNTNEVIISNTPPEITDVLVITQSGAPTRVATITTDLIGYSDSDNDPEGVHLYEWYVNGIAVPGQFNITLQNSLDNTYFTKGDIITVMVWPSDGTNYGDPVRSSNEITIINTEPELTGADLDWDDELNATSEVTVSALDYYSDPDGDLFAFFYYEWFVNSESVVLLYDVNTISGIFVSRDRVYCRVTPNDGEDNGSAVFTDSVLVMDSPPEIYGRASLATDIFPANEYATISVDTSKLYTADIDGDGTTYVFRWYVNGFPAGAPTVNSLTGTYFNKDDTISCRIYAYDGTLESSSFIESTPFDVENTAPVANINRPFDNSFADVNEEVRLDATGSFDPDEVDDEFLIFTWLVDGEQKGVGIKLDVILEPGDHIIKVVVSDGKLSDSAEANIHIRAPDLLINEGRIIFSGTKYVDKTINIVVDIGNIGDGNAYNVTVRFYVDGKSIGDIRNINVSSENNETISMSWKAKEGSHTIRVELDPNDQIQDSDDDNNVADLDISISKEPDEEDLLYGVKPLYVYIILALIVIAAVVGLMDVARWRRGGRRRLRKE